MQELAYLVLLGPNEMLVLLVLAALIVPRIVYLLTLQTALSRCSRENRTFPAGIVWLGLIPLFNLVWDFVLVIGVSKSLGNEFRSRGIAEAPRPGLAMGLAMAICSISYMVPRIGTWIAISGYVFWVIYWVMIARYSARIAVPVASQPQEA